MFNNAPENKTSHVKSLKVSSKFSTGLLIDIQIEGMVPNDESLILEVAKEARQMITIRALNDEFPFQDDPKQNTLLREILKNVDIIPVDKTRIFLQSADYDRLVLFFETEHFPKYKFFHLEQKEREYLENLVFKKPKNQVKFLECWTRTGGSGTYVTCDGGGGGVPIIPKGINIYNNIKEVEENYGDLLWFYNQFRNHGPWDYKQRGSQYEDFGNFHYGVVGKAIGIPDQVLLRGAGWAQKQAGTSKEEWNEWYGSAPYGDDPKDQEQIKNGIEYYEKN